MFEEINYFIILLEKTNCTYLLEYSGIEKKAGILAFIV